MPRKFNNKLKLRAHSIYRPLYLIKTDKLVSENFQVVVAIIGGITVYRSSLPRMDGHSYAIRPFNYQLQRIISVLQRNIIRQFGA